MYLDISVKDQVHHMVLHGNKGGLKERHPSFLQSGIADLLSACRFYANHEQANKKWGYSRDSMHSGSCCTSLVFCAFLYLQGL
jgi:hypothetical protein